MTWLRRHRRSFAVLGALAFVLQALAVVIASGAHAAAISGGDGNLVVICTAQGAKIVDLNNPDADPVDLGSHQCPLCIVGCTACATPALDPALLTVVVSVLLPTEQPALPAPAESNVAQLRFVWKTASPRGPPAMA